MIENILSTFTLKDLLPLGIGLALGAGVLLLIRARQVWQYRRTYGYSTYTADHVRRRLIGSGVVAVVIVIAIAGLYLWRANTGSPLDGQVVRSDDLDAALGVADLDHMRLIIPRLGVETTFIEASFVADQWDISQLEAEVAHLAGTAYPGQPGNVVLAGHITIPVRDTPGPFYELDQLQNGDKIYVEHRNTTYTYEVFRNLLVESTDIEVVFPTDDNRLTLITCSGWDGSLQAYAQRLVVVARFIQ